MGVPERPVLPVSAAKALKGNPAHTIFLRQTECQKKGETITAAVYEYLVDNDGEWGKLRFDFENGNSGDRKTGRLGHDEIKRFCKSCDTICEVSFKAGIREASYRLVC